MKNSEYTIIGNGDIRAIYDSEGDYIGEIRKVDDKWLDSFDDSQHETPAEAAQTVYNRNLDNNFYRGEALSLTDEA